MYDFIVVYRCDGLERREMMSCDSEQEARALWQRNHPLLTILRVYKIED